MAKAPCDPGFLRDTEQSEENDWDEIDLQAQLWTIPGERVKGGETHKVSLTSAAVKLLISQPRLSKYVFPGPRAAGRK